MRGLEAWVTTVVEDQDVPKAFILARSLRRSLTTKCLVVVVSPSLDSKSRSLLGEIFDQVFSVDQHSVNGWISMKDYAKLYCFNLTLFRKCVFLDLETLVLKNSDELFDSFDENFGAVMRSDGMDLSVMSFVPSQKLFENLVTSGKKSYTFASGPASFEEYLKQWLLNQNNFAKLEEKYNFSGSCGWASTSDFCIAKLPQEVTRNGLRSDDMVDSAVAKYWRTLYAEIHSRSNEIKIIQNPVREKSCALRPDGHDSIAIVGISCRHAGASNLDEFWKLLINGHEGVKPVPSDRWTKDNGSKCDSSYQSTMGGFISQAVDEFDGKLFGISPKEMEFLDPQQRLLLEVTWEALENAAIDPLSLHRSHGGVFVGAWMNDYKDLMFRLGSDEFYRMYMGNSFGAAAARLSFFLGLTGPSVATESGCSSAMVAVDLACKSLRQGETSLALACGVNLLLLPFNKDTMSFVIAGDGRCKTFDESADGFGRAEGCGVLVLKRYADAVKDGDNIWALIRGSSCVQEGVSRSMGTPTRECEALAMTLALKDAGVEPNDVSFVEAHGTGTSLGDPLEITAIADVYGKNRSKPLVVGSVKTNVGHTESCSGITGIIKVVTSLQHEIIPPHLNLKTLNPKINLDAIPAQIPIKAMAWPKNSSGKPRLAGVSSFGITGTDGHLIIQETPELVESSGFFFNLKRPMHIMKLSAKTEEALEAMLNEYNSFLRDEAPKQNLELKDIAFTANIGRASFTHRAVVIAKDAGEACKIIQTKKYAKSEVSEGVHGKICFLFTGQGSQYAGMAKEIYECSPVFRLHFDHCQKILDKNHGLSIKNAIWGITSKNDISKTLYSQTAIFCVEYSLLKLWESWGIKPDYVLGHSLGEFAAAVGANMISLEDAIKLVAERSRLVESLPKGKMLVLKTDKATAERILQECTSINPGFWLDFAAVNSPEQTVLAGTSEAVEKFAEFCSQKKSMKIHVLDASHAFHSRLMEPILEKYRNVAGSIKQAASKGRDDNIKYISGVYGKLIADNDDLLSPQYWVNHTREKVNFTEACKAVAAEGCKFFLEVGPQPILSALVLANTKSGMATCLPSLRRTEDNWKTILGSLEKLYLNGWNPDWHGVDKFYNKSKLRLPSYPFQRKKYWFDVQSMGGGSGIANSTVIHPLLGAVFPNASGAKIYQNGLDLKRLEYIPDHCVGNRIIFPGAGYLEMCLAAGHSATEGIIDVFCRPSGPLTIENLKIVAPLAMHQKQACYMQVVIDSKTADINDVSSGMKVEVFHQHMMEGEAPKWSQHAVSYFTPAPVNFDEIRFRAAYNFSEIKDACRVDVGISDVYGKLAEVGLKFGPCFQSLVKVWKSEKGVLAETKIPADFKDYIVHPVLLDAMLQTGMVVQSRGSPTQKLTVPISIKKFTWLDNTDSDKFLIYSEFLPENGASKDMVSVLFDEHGKIICVMEGMEFIETTVQAMETLLESQETELPSLQHEVWKPHLGPNQSRVNIWDVFKENAMFNSNIMEIFKTSNEMTKEGLAREDLFEQLNYAYILNTYYELGWVPSMGQRIHIDKFMSDFRILPQFRKLCRYQMTVLEREGIIKFLSDLEIQTVKIPPPILEVHQLIQRFFKKAETFESVSNSISIYTSCGSSYASIMQGKESALNILFPQDPSKPSAETYYTEGYNYSGMAEKVLNHFKLMLNDPSSRTTTGIFRVLEVGAGTGNFTFGILKLLLEYGVEVEYTFTDISPAFFVNASKKFEEYKGCIKYQVFNIEDDAKSQGFSPGYFDAIVGGDVVHATRDLRESLSNLRQLLRPTGFLCLIEGAKANHVTSIFGLLDGYWRFVDSDVRQHHPLVDCETWKKLCLSSGFDRAVAIPCSANFYAFVLAGTSSQEIQINRPITYSTSGQWLVFSNMDEISKKLVHKLSLYCPTIQVCKSKNFQKSEDGRIYGINVEKKEHMMKLFSNLASANSSSASRIEGIIYLWGLAGGKVDQTEISQPFLCLCQGIAEIKQTTVPKVFVYTKGNIPLGDHVFENPASSTLWGISKSCANELNMRIKIIDLSPDEESASCVEDAFHELWNEDPDLFIAYREKTRHFGKMLRTKLAEKALKLPQCDRFQLILPQTKVISDLKFGTLGKYSLKENEIEIQVKAAALNFRDVFAVMKPDAQFEKLNVVGSDFAGIVASVGINVTKWKIGDAVFGCNLGDGALPSHVRIIEEAVVAKPSRFTFAEAATLPAVFATAYYSLVTVAKMQPGETVLIHTASGGVGLSAIQIAQQIGARVIATAGSARKRAYLRNLGIQHIFHSRNTKYGEEILKATGGKGVDIVLNSLTGPGFKEASLNVCNRNARFIEMSKLSIWQPEEVKVLRPDVAYTIVDLTSVSTDVWSMLFETMDRFMKDGMLNPISYVRFDGVHIREALTYLQKAKHIGKIVCIMPEVKLQAGYYTPHTSLFNEEGTYLITGGLGGIGFEVMKWMLAQGAKNLIVVSRSQPQEKQLQIIESLRAQNKNIITKAVDVGDYTTCKSLIAFIQDPASQLPPLRGVMHCAGVLSDATMINQSWDKFLTTFRPKVKGGWNLHELTRDCPLEHFIMFSSMAALTGPPGQSNHAAGNAYLDALAQYRDSIGLPGITVNWGQWGNVGVAASKEVRGVIPFSSQRGIATLEALMKSQRTQTCVIDMDTAIIIKVHPQGKYYMQGLLAGSSTSGDGSGLPCSIKSEKFWEDVDSAKEEDKVKVIKQYVKIILRQILKLEEEEPVEDNGNFQDMGLDSLMMIELKNTLQTVLGTRIIIGASALADCHNIELLAERLLTQLNDSAGFDSDSDMSPGEKLSKEEMKTLIEEDSKLPEHIHAVEGQLPVGIGNAQKFLMTGITGNLGPHILASLLKYPQVDKVYCLLRKSSDPTQRLEGFLKEAKLEDEVDMKKVNLIIGDITTPKFGLDDEEYDLLAKEVDAVIHCAVKSNHVEGYGMSRMRKVNVLGTLAVLEFASHLKTKHVFHSSSLIAVASTDKDGYFSDDWPVEDELEGVTDLGYPISKMICDRLVHQAIGRGIPCKSFRFGGLVGHSETGRYKHHNNHFMLRFLCFMKLGAMPSIPVPAILLPVDVAATTSLKIFFSKETSDIYNLFHPNPSLEQEFPMLAKEFGYEIDIVDYGEFINKFSKEGQDSILYPFKELYENEEKYNSLVSFPNAIQKWLENPDKFFNMKKVVRVVPDYVEKMQPTWEYLRRDLHYARDTGLFDKFKLSKQ